MELIYQKYDLTNVVYWKPLENWQKKANSRTKRDRKILFEDLDSVYVIYTKNIQKKTQLFKYSANILNL